MLCEEDNMRRPGFVMHLKRKSVYQLEWMTFAHYALRLVYI